MWVKGQEIAHGTRDRWTANGWGGAGQATALAGPPLEVLFKGGEQVLTRRLT